MHELCSVIFVCKARTKYARPENTSCSIFASSCCESPPLSDTLALLRVWQAFTVEEVKERQAELSKMRALMFYQERKQHHMNKIKSKVLCFAPPD